jgi:hypothetical protein
MEYLIFEKTYSSFEGALLENLHCILRRNDTIELFKIQQIDKCFVVTLTEKS